MFAYLDASNNVVATSTTEYTLEDAQASIPTAASVISGAPAGLVAVGQESETIPYHHVWSHGDGTDLTHYGRGHAYSYSVSDTSNNDVVYDELFGEIASAPDIEATVVRVGGQGADIWVVFDSDLSVNEEAALDAVVAAHASTPISYDVGDDYYSARDMTETVANNQSYQCKVVLHSPRLTGRFRIQWQANVSSSNDVKKLRVRLQNITDDETVGYPAVIKHRKGNEVYAGAIGEVTLTDEAKSFELQYKAENSTITIKDARIEMWRVS